MARPGSFAAAIVTVAELNALGAVYTSATRPTGADVYEGLHIWETDTDRWMMYDGTNWIVMAEPTQSYTPTTTGITLGTGGTTTGSYHRSDGYCDFGIKVVLGTGGALTASPTFTLPKQALNAANSSLEVTPALLYDSDVDGRYYGAAFVSTTTVLGLRAYNSSTTYVTAAGLAATVPFTWAANDIIEVSGRYQMTTRQS